MGTCRGGEIGAMPLGPDIDTRGLFERGSRGERGAGEDIGGLRGVA